MPSAFIRDTPKDRCFSRTCAHASASSAAGRQIGLAIAESTTMPPSGSSHTTSSRRPWTSGELAASSAPSGTPAATARGHATRVRAALEQQVRSGGDPVGGRLVQNPCQTRELTSQTRAFASVCLRAHAARTEHARYSGYWYVRDGASKALTNFVNEVSDDHHNQRMA